MEQFDVRKIKNHTQQCVIQGHTHTQYNYKKPTKFRLGQGTACEKAYGNSEAEVGTRLTTLKCIL